MLKRARQLVHSDYGRDFGWFVEYENRVVGELDDRRWGDMFWDTYRITPASRDAEAILLNDDLWNRCDVPLSEPGDERLRRARNVWRAAFHREGSRKHARLVSRAQVIH